jgi:beta-glucanase (GH16 family)
MTRASTPVVLAVLLSAAGLGATRAHRAGAPTTVFFDDFSGPSLDRSTWNVVVTGRTVNNEQQAYVDSPDTVDFVTGADAQGAENGALRIHPRYREGFLTPEGRKFDFISGRLDTRGKVEFDHGTVSARVKLTAGQGLWPAFWILGTGQWPATGEADILENVGESDWTNFAMHGPGYSGNTPLAYRRHFPAGQDITGWHVYTCVWTGDSLSFVVDGETSYVVTKDQVSKYGAWAYDNDKYVIVNFAVGGDYPRAVNHATAPYNGLPQATVDLIKQDQVTMLVDWVRVTKDTP